MAEIRPFHALRFDSSRVKLADVLTQPYDKITPAMQQAYYQRSPHNLVRFELGKPEPTDGDSANVYTRAAEFLRQQQREGILRRDGPVSFYAYIQKFAHPLHPERTISRTGLIALGRIYDYEDKVVFRHERTLAKPRADRVNLLRASRTHSGQLFMLYEDLSNQVENLVCGAITGRPSDESVVDEYGVENLLWRMDNPSLIKQLTGAMADKRLIIADGHHRYETAQEYRDACRAHSTNRDAPHEFVMMTLVNMASPGLVVLPTHRVVRGVEGFDPRKLRRGLEEFCLVKTTASGGDALLAELAEMGRATPVGAAPAGGPGARSAFAVVTREGSLLAQSKPEKVDLLLKDFSPLERRLDVVALHEAILRGILNISAEAVREQRNVRYFRSAAEAVQEIASGADATFLLNPVSVSTMRDVCYAGGVMPQKSTDFYPKLLSGLTLDNLDQCF